MTTKPVPRLLSVRAMSEATTIPQSSIYTWIAAGDLPAVRIGTSIRVREDDLLHFIEAHSQVAS